MFRRSLRVLVTLILALWAAAGGCAALAIQATGIARRPMEMI